MKPLLFIKASIFLCASLRQVRGFLTSSFATCTSQTTSRNPIPHARTVGEREETEMSTSSSTTTGISIANNNENENENDDSNLQLARRYLQRIGFSNEESASILEKEEMTLTTMDLQSLLSAHLRHVPFENMDLMTHPSARGTSGETTVSFIKRKEPSDLPSLDVKRSLHKIINQNRGGFCYEVNLSFCWLLRQIGYQARLAVSDVFCKQEYPAHVVILVDGLMDMDVGKGMDVPILVDVGFGCPGVCHVILPLEYDTIYSDLYGDEFSFVPQTSKLNEYPLHKGRFDTILYRRRVDSSNELQPMYRFHSKDDLENDAPEFQKGLQYVLSSSPTFNEKRLCVVSTERGHITLGTDYVKWVERWETVRQIDLLTEDNWRAALRQYFCVQLE